MITDATLWSRFARHYNAMFAVHGHRANLESIALQIPQGIRVLDVGCGSGRLGEFCQPGTLLYGIDSSDAMVELARNQGYQEATAGSATAIPYGDNHFGLVVANNVWYLLSPTDQASAFREVHRVLEPGGTFVMVTPINNRLLPLVLDHCRHASPREWLALSRSLPLLAVWYMACLLAPRRPRLGCEKIVELAEAAGFFVTARESAYAGIGTKFIFFKPDA